MKQSTQPREATPITQVDEYLDYFQTIRPAEPPRASFRDIELLSQTIAIRIWALRSEHSLAAVLIDGFFDDVKDVRLKKEDRIEVVASWGQPIAEHATLVVDHVDNIGNAKVSVMLRYERGI
jgi:hypothetical protein